MTTTFLLVALAPRGDSTDTRAGSSVESDTDFFTLFLAPALPLQKEGEEGGQGTSLPLAELSPADPSSPGQIETGLFLFPLLSANVRNDLTLDTRTVQAASVNALTGANLLSAGQRGKFQVTAWQSEDSPLSFGDSVQSFPKDLLQTQELPTVASLPYVPTLSDSAQGEQTSLPFLPHLQGQYVVKQDSDANLFLQRGDQLAVDQDQAPASAGKILSPSKEESVGFSPATTPSLGSFSSLVVAPFLQSHGRPEQQSKKQESSAVHTHADEESEDLDAAQVQMMDRNGKPMRPTTEPLLFVLERDLSSADKNEALLTAPSSLTTERRLVPGEIQSTASPASAKREIVGGWKAVIEQVAGQIFAHISRNNQEALIQLEPPELGKLKIDLVLEGDRVQARIVAESADIGVLIQSHLSELKQALHGHSLDLDRVRVDVNGGEQQDNFAQGFQQDSRTGEGRGGTATLSQETEQAERETEENSRRAAVGHSSKVNVWA